MAPRHRAFSTAVRITLPPLGAELVELRRRPSPIACNRKVVQ